jgi:peptidoglycan/LPS O-acetylase OafA/YrhL
MGEPHSGRIPSLDGIRAFSVAAVILGHLVGTNNFCIQSLKYDFAGLGLRFFFVLSGFLITTLLISEYATRGSISLLKFYYRRTMRIFPPFYTLILTVIILNELGWIIIQENDILLATVYMTNFFQERSWWLGHTWSLSVEEQFYLLWPAIIVFFGPRHGLKVAVTIYCLGPLFRVGTFYVFGKLGEPGIGETFPTVADSLAVGCMLALTREKLETNKKYMSGLDSCLAPAAFALLFIVHASKFVLPNWAIGISIENVCVAICLHWAITYPEGYWGRVLNSWPVVYLGTISYSLYLWQQLFLNRNSFAWINSFPQNVIATLAISSLAYYIIERPALRLRKHLEDKFFLHKS